MTPEVTAAICTRDRPEQVRRALRSLVAQAAEPAEILVVDNAPRDGATRELLADEFPRVRYVSEPVPGLDAARNRALVAARNDIVAFLDDDAVAHPDWIATLARAFAERPTAAACTGRVDPLALDTPAQRLFEANGGLPGPRGPRRLVLPEDGAQLMRGRRTPRIAWAFTAGSGCNLALRRSVALALGGFDEVLDWGASLAGGGDTDMLWRLLEGGAEVVCEPRARVWHEHRRDLAEVANKLVGYHQGNVTLLTKAIGRSRGRARLSLLAYLAWRLMKPVVRLVRRARGRVPVPAAVLLRMVWSGWTALGTYGRAVQRRDGRAVLRAGEPPPRPGDRGRIALWRYRELLRGLVLRNLRVKYQRSVLGFVWTLLNPLATLVVLAAVFSHVVRLPVPAYWAFLLSGYFVWNFVSQTLNAGTYVFAEHARLLRSAAFPAEILVLGVAIARLVEFTAAIALVLLALVVFHHHGIPVSLVLLPAVLVLQLLVVVGLALPITTLSVFYRDVQHALPIALTTLFYASPVFYPAWLVPDAMRPLYMLNPVAGLLTLYHALLYEGRFPPPGLLAGMIAGSLAICAAGYAIFRRYARVYAEVV